VLRLKEWSLHGVDRENFNFTFFVLGSLLPNVTRTAPQIYLYCYPTNADWNSSVGIATLYGLDGPGIGSRWEARLFAPVQTGPEAHPAPYTMGTGSFPGVKRPGCGVDHRPQSSAEVKERVEVYFYSPSVPSWQAIG
jgi:hypothetical protein